MDIDTATQEAIETLKTLITIPSFSKQEDKAADYLQDRLETYFPGQVSRTGNNVTATINGKSKGDTLLLCSHLDTVQVVPGWTRDPFGAEIEGDRIYGLGSNDAGASLVSMIAAVRLLENDFSGKIILSLVGEEETGSAGFYTLESALPRYDAAIFGEPTNMQMASTMRGSMMLKLHSHGVGCHASMPKNGRNAIDKFCEDLLALRALDLKDNSPWGGATMEPTLIEGGKSVNQIPALVETTFDVRTTPEKNNAWLLEQVKATGVDFTTIFNRRQPMFNPPTSKIVAAFLKSGLNKTECIFNGTCDMAFARAPSIILGPGGLDVAHVADEYTEISAIHNATAAYKSVISLFFRQ